MKKESIKKTIKMRRWLSLMKNQKNINGKKNETINK